MSPLFSAYFVSTFLTHDITITEDPAAFVVVQSTAQAGVSRVLEKIGYGLDAEGGEERGPTSSGLPKALRRRILHQMRPPRSGYPSAKNVAGGG